MKSKKTTIKIKRSKVNLYNKKKNKAKHVIAIIITAAAACALCILGYGIGKPVMDYFRGQGLQSSSSSVWTPANTENSTGIVPVSSGQGSAGSSSNAGGNEPLPNTVKSAYYLSEEAALSLDSLDSELSAAKNSGHSVVVVTLKDSDGLFLYKSSIKRVKSEGTLTAEEIADEIEKAGFVPAAKISTLKDKSNGIAFGCHYTFSNGGTWLDGRPGIGKTWISPFSDKTPGFIKSITEELSQAGFKRIIAAETMYPNFYPVDISKNLAHLPLSDRAKRAEALWKVIDAAKEGAEAGGAELYVEMDGAKMIAPKKDGTNAELAFDADSLKTANIIVDYSPSGTADDPYSAAKEFIESLKQSLNGAECTVRITGGSSAEAVQNVKKAFDEAKIPAFSQ